MKGASEGNLSYIYLNLTLDLSPQYLIKTNDKGLKIKALKTNASKWRSQVEVIAIDILEKRIVIEFQSWCIAVYYKSVLLKPIFGYEVSAVIVIDFTSLYLQRKHNGQDKENKVYFHFQRVIFPDYFPNNFTLS